MTTRSLLLIGALGLGLSADPLDAQSSTAPLRLRDVLSAVETSGFEPRAARADARAAEADIRAALPGFLPQLRADIGTARTTDPIGVFGAKLRQRTVTTADFDPSRLNHPEALSVTSGALVLEQPILAPQALLGRRTAALAARAAHAMADRQTHTAMLDATRGYYGAVLATASVAALDSAVAAARRHVRQASTLERNGVVTRSDLLLAQVRLGELEAQRAMVQGQAHTARQGLAVQMGRPGDTLAALPAMLPPAAAIRALLVDGWPHDHNTPGAAPLRDDVRAAAFGADAARADVRRASARWLPSVGAVVRSDWVTVDQPFGGRPFWTAGLMVSVPVFSGGGEIADRERAVARAGAATARAEGAAAMAALEVTQARIQRDVAIERLAIAEQALTQGEEALRLVQRRYDGGLAAITELLDAGAARTASDLATVAARHDLLVALAAERVALGLSLAPLFALD